MKSLRVAAIIDYDIKASCDSDDYLMQIFVGMPTPLGTAGYIVEVIDSFNIERYVLIALDKTLDCHVDHEF